jgi:hypothetical protein
MINDLNNEELTVLFSDLSQEGKIPDLPEPVSGEVFRRMSPILGGIGAGARAAAAAMAAREAP